MIESAQPPLPPHSRRLNRENSPARPWLFFPVALICVTFLVYYFAKPTPRPRRNIERLAPLELQAFPPVPPFQDDPDALRDVRDRVFAEMILFEEKPFFHLIHKARAQDPATRTPSPLPDLEKLREDSETLRGKAYFCSGRFGKCWPYSLPTGNPSGLSGISFGTVYVESGETVFFAVQHDPTLEDFFAGDSVQITGYFFKNFADETMQASGPLFIAPRVQRAPVPEFTDDWQSVRTTIPTQNATEGNFDVLSELSAEGFYYFLHKVLSESEEQLTKKIDSEVGVKTMWGTPDLACGKVARIRGWIAKPFTRKSLFTPNRVGRGWVWEGQISVRFNDQLLLFTVNFTERPEVISGCTVEFVGYFQQLLAYKKMDDPKEAVVSAFLVGKKISFVE